MKLSPIGVRMLQLFPQLKGVDNITTEFQAD
jgi:hypothetical protein